MGTLLGLTVFLAFFYNPPTATQERDPAPILKDDTPPPELDPAILARIHDETRTNRLTIEQEALEHLLEKSLRVTPTISEKLGLPAEPVPIAQLRGSPGKYRGRYLWYKGELDYLSKSKPGHPVRNYEIREGRMKTEDGNFVLFYISLPPDEGLKIGDWVRVEGFFLKLRDTNLPTKLDLAPVLVGPEVMRSHADWDAVEALDPSVLARVEDGILENGELQDEQDMRLTLDESQDVPLWHLTSYARSQAKPFTTDLREAIPAFVTRDQWRECESGRTPKGTPFRLLGTLQMWRTMPAKNNPLHIEHWSEAWIQCRDLGGRTIPVWVPEPVGEGWLRGQAVEIHAYFFKRYLYTGLDPEGLQFQRRKDYYAPIFVASAITKYDLPKDILTNQITIAFSSLIIIVIIVFLVSSLRDRKRSLAFESELVERRRKRRSRTSETTTVKP